MITDWIGLHSVLLPLLIKSKPYNTWLDTPQRVWNKLFKNLTHTPEGFLTNIIIVYIKCVYYLFNKALINCV